MMQALIGGDKEGYKNTLCSAKAQMLDGPQLDAVFQASGALAKSEHTLTDIQVNGDRASGMLQSMRQKFVREQDGWKYCGPDLGAS